MRLIQDTAGWRPLDSAPVERDVTLLVIDGASEPYQLKLPSRLTAAGWVSSAKGTPLAVTPAKWKPYVPPRPARPPRKKKMTPSVGRPVEPATLVERSAFLFGWTGVARF
jgi:hypothetical protein